jgi:DNA-binding protein H-NS
MRWQRWTGIDWLTERFFHYFVSRRAYAHVWKEREDAKITASKYKESAEGSWREYEKVRKELDKWKSAAEHEKAVFLECYERASVLLRERDELQAKLDNYMAEDFRTEEIAEQRDVAQAELAETKEKLTTLRHLVNDAAIEANELSETNECGAGANNGQSVDEYGYMLTNGLLIDPITGRQPNPQTSGNSEGI